MEFKLIEYLEDVARSSIYIAHTDSDPHFSIASGLSEIEQFLSNMLVADKVQLIALSDLSGGFENSSDVNLFERPYHQFMIVKKQDQLGNMAEHDIALRECKLIGKKIFAKMCHDQLNASRLPASQDPFGLRALDQRSIKYFSVGPIADNFVGIQFSFATGQQDTEVYDPDEWEIIS